MNEIKIIRTLETCDIDDLYKFLKNSLSTDSDFLLDFTDIQRLKVEDIINIKSVCMRLRDKGSNIKIKNIPYALRKLFMSSGQNNLDEVITI